MSGGGMFQAAPYGGSKRQSDRGYPDYSPGFDAPKRARVDDGRLGQMPYDPYGVSFPYSPAAAYNHPYMSPSRGYGPPPMGSGMGSPPRGGGPGGGKMGLLQPQQLVAGMWKCLECGNINYPTRTSCNMRKCGAPKPVEGEQVDLWKCLECGNFNYPSRTACNRRKCRAPRNIKKEGKSQDLSQSPIVERSEVAGVGQSSSSGPPNDNLSLGGSGKPSHDGHPQEV